MKISVFVDEMLQLIETTQGEGVLLVLTKSVLLYEIEKSEQVPDKHDYDIVPVEQ